jgi:hypothetical protein
MGTSFHGVRTGKPREGSVGPPGVGSSNGDLERCLNGALGLNSSVKGTWKEKSLAGHPEEYVEKTGFGHLFP